MTKKMQFSDANAFSSCKLSKLCFILYIFELAVSPRNSELGTVWHNVFCFQVVDSRSKLRERKKRPH